MEEILCPLILSNMVLKYVAILAANRGVMYFSKMVSSAPSFPSDN